MINDELMLMLVLVIGQKAEVRGEKDAITPAIVVEAADCC